MSDQRGQHVLVIDDNEAARTTAAAVLKTAGYKVTVAGDSAGAVEQLAKNHYAVILLDFKMPHDGVAMIDYMSENLPDLLARTVVFVPAVNRPIWGVLPKPFHVDELVKMVDACVEGR
jgi:CheY-like chemotaxis protein